MGPALRRLSGLHRVTDAIGAALFAAVFLLFCAKIALRYALHDELAWTDEVATVLFVWIVFWADTFMLAERDHIRFDLVVHLAGPRVRRAMALLRAVLLGGIFLWALPATLDYITFLWRERTPVLGWRLDWVYSCFGLFALSVPIRCAIDAGRALRPGWTDSTPSAAP